MYDEIIRLYDQAEENGFPIGEALYSQCPHFCDYALLLDNKIQARIKEFNYCKLFSCSPHKDLQSTPVKIINDYMIIEQEYNYCIKSKQKEANNA